MTQQRQKLRPVDDGLEAQVSPAYTSTLELAFKTSSLRLPYRSFWEEYGGKNWIGKCLGLSKAYKQFPLLPHHQETAVVHFKSPNGHPKFYSPNSLMFGVTAAVFGCNRASRAPRRLLHCCLAELPAIYFNDFVFCLALRPSAGEVGSICSAFLTFLGWNQYLAGQKGRPFQFTLDVLGMTLDLNSPEDGKVTLKNEESRI